MRFRQRTDRSIKRWGRFPRADLKRKQYAHVYSELEETAMDRTGSTTTDIVLFDDTDFDTTDPAATRIGCRNISVDMWAGFAWSPQVTTLEYDTWHLKWGVFLLDADQTSAPIDSEFGSQPAICWGAQIFNSGEQPTALGVSPERRSWNIRKRFKVNYLRHDEQIRFLCLPNGAMQGAVIDLRLSMFMRFRFEIP